MHVQFSCSRCGAAYDDWSQRAREHLLAKFWANVDRNGPVPHHRPDLGPCWLWTGYATGPYGGRYGRITVGKQQRQATHRFSWELVNGPIPDGLTLDHLCRVTRCVRPDHLEVVTLAENSRRNRRDGFCRRGHAYTLENTIIGKLGRQCRTCTNDSHRRWYRVPVSPKHPVLRGESIGNATLTEQAVREIRADHAAGMSIAALARARGVGRTTISMVVNRKTWRHVL
jgi:hypothetical protein